MGNPAKKKARPVFEPATLVDMVALETGITAHCRKCGHWKRLRPDQLGLPMSRSVPSLEGVFKCSICCSRNTCAMPEYKRPLPGSLDPKV